MIELPEATVLANEIDEALAGKQVEKVIAGAAPHKFAFFYNGAENYPSLLEKKVLKGAFNQGGFIRIEFNDDVTLLLSEGIRLRYFQAETSIPEKHQLYIGFSDGSFLIATVQMYGMISAFSGDEYDDKYYSVAREKPSPLTMEFDRAYFETLLSNSSEKLSMKAFLATEQRIPGLGNGVLQDILYNARLHPKKKLSTLSGEDKYAMFNSIKNTLQQMTEQGGRDTEQDIFGYPGSYQSILCKNTVGKPCTKCGTIIEKQSYMGGSIYVCPECQKL